MKNNNKVVPMHPKTSKKVSTNESSTLDISATEVEQLNIREQIIQKKLNDAGQKEMEARVLRIEAQLIQREGVMYLNEIISKYGASRIWKRQGNVLVRDSKPQNQPIAPTPAVEQPTKATNDTNIPQG